MIAVAVSGGVDSLMALYLLKHQAKEPFAIHGFFLPPGPKELATQDRLQSLCRKLEIALYSFELSTQFEELVIAPFLRSHSLGLTPNPCALCNREVKFGLLLEKAEKLGADQLATGHYALATTDSGHHPVLSRGKDPAKEQSYFLALLQKSQIAKAVFPLGAWRKDQVIHTLNKLGVEAPLKQESQEVCFIPDNDYGFFLEQSGVALPGPGPIKDSSGKTLGEHAGLHRFTIGQRRGLRIPFSQPLYVLDKDLSENTLLVGTREELTSFSCIVSELNWITDPDPWPDEVLVQTRYRQQADWARLQPLDEQRLRVCFQAPRKPATPGQVAAFYTRAGQLLGGGIIS